MGIPRNGDSTHTMGHDRYNRNADNTALGHMSLILRTGVVFLTLSTVLFTIDLVPEPRVSASPEEIQAEAQGARLEALAPATVAAQDGEGPVSSLSTSVSYTNATQPVHINIDAIGVDAPVINPSSTDIEVLDRALLSGAVHYPGSGRPGEVANMLIFAHSSYLPVVHNKAYQAFNDLQDLEIGTYIVIETERERFSYKVVSVERVRANDATIWFASNVSKLTLVTCDTFGSKQDRWVAEALFVSREAI